MATMKKQQKFMKEDNDPLRQTVLDEKIMSEIVLEEVKNQRIEIRQVKELVKDLQMVVKELSKVRSDHVSVKSIMTNSGKQTPPPPRGKFYFYINYLMEV